MYSEAIRLLPSCAAYYGNRSATYMMLNKFTDALEDAKQATTIDKEFTKVGLPWHLLFSWYLTAGNVTFPAYGLRSVDHMRNVTAEDLVK